MNNILIFVLLLMGCDNDPPKPVNPDLPTTDSSIVWKYKLPVPGRSTSVYINDSSVIIGIEENGPFRLFCFNKESGKVIWEQTNFPPGFSPVSGEKSALSGNYLVMSSGSWIVSTDITNGVEMWRRQLDHGYSQICIIDNWVYKASHKSYKNTSELNRYNLMDGSVEEVFALDRVKDCDGYSPFIRMPVKWVHPSGDEILIVQNRGYGWYKNYQSRMDILAYNLTADSVLWYRDSLDSRSSIARPLIENDMVYFHGFYHTYAISPENGNTIWKFNVAKDDESVFATSNILIYEDVLIVKPENRWLFGVNPDNGKELWSNSATESSPGLMTTGFGLIFYGEYHLNAYNITTGKEEIKLEPSNGGMYLNPIGIDPNTGFIYTTDTRYVYCYDLDKLK